jgi:Tol biopolymer transport system component
VLHPVRDAFDAVRRSFEVRGPVALRGEREHHHEAVADDAKGVCVSHRIARLIVLTIVFLAALQTSVWASGAPIAFERHGDLFAMRLGRRPVRLTRTAAREHRPSWSPGDTELAFVVGRRRVGVLSLATGTRRVIALLPESIDAILALAWSPKGDRIAIGAMNQFRRDGKSRLNGSVWSLRADGTGLRRVVTGQGMVTGLAWLRHGRTIVASTEWPNGVILWHRKAPLGIVSFAPDGSDVRLVLDTLASDLDASPDGRRLVYRGWRRTCHACGEIWRSSITGSGEHVIALPPPGWYGLYDPAYSPTGKRIALLAATGESLSMWVMRPDGSRLHRVLRDVRSLDW